MSAKALVRSTSANFCGLRVSAFIPRREKRQRAAAVQDAGRGTLMIGKRVASWSAPALWSFVGRAPISSIAPLPKRRRLPALVAQVLQKIFDQILHKN
jgi:hypothetical protein